MIEPFMRSYTIIMIAQMLYAIIIAFQIIQNTQVYTQWTITVLDFSPTPWKRYAITSNKYQVFLVVIVYFCSAVGCRDWKDRTY